MSPVRRDELGANYASQLVACVVLVIGGFMVYPDDRRSGDECYTAQEDESMDVDELQRLSGWSLAQRFDSIPPAAQSPRTF